MDAEPILLKADPLGDAQTPFRGYLDVVDIRYGISGWALNRESPQTPVTVEVLAAGECIARRTTSQPRTDVSLEHVGSCVPGFHFDAQELHLLPVIAEARPDAKLIVRVAGPTFAIHGNRPMPSAQEFLLGHIAEGYADPSAALTQVELPPVKDLSAALALLRRIAEQGAVQPVLSQSQGIAGFIEAVSTEMAGFLWFLGWIKGEDRFALSGVMMDRGKYPAGLLFATYPRPDLPEGAVGMIGVMHTDWRSSDPKEIAVLHFGESGTQQLRTNAPLVELRLQDWMARFNKLRPQLLSPVVPELRRLTGLVSNWITGNATTLDVTIEQGMDRVLVLPGFGAFMEGWVVSPARRPGSLMLRLGDRILEADPAATFFKPRPDLAGKLPGGGHIAETAGFVAVFRGNVRAEDMTRPIIKFVFTADLSTNHEFDGRTLRMVGTSGQLEDVRTFYREPAAERFFPAFSRAMAASASSNLRQLTPFTVAGAEQALVWTLPDDSSEIHLGFAELTGMLRRGFVPGIAILAEPGSHRSLVTSLFQALARRAEAPCSLFFLPRAENAPYVLKKVIDLLRAERFAFIGPGLHPDAPAMEAIGKALRCVGPILPFALPIYSGVETHSRSTSTASAEAFLASRNEAESWLRDLPTRISGLASGHLRIPLPVAKDKGKLLRSWSVEPSRLAEAVNQVLAEAPQ